MTGPYGGAGERRGPQRQEVRLAIGGLYLLALLAMAPSVTGQTPPPFATNGLWFYAGFLPLILARFIIEPYFTRPADALANGLALLVAAATLDPAARQIPTLAFDTGRFAIAAYAAITLVVAVIAMLGRDQSSPFFSAGPPATGLAASIGRAEVGFSLLLGFTGAIAFADEPPKIGLLVAAWVILLFIRPLEWLAAFIWRQRRLRPTAGGVAADGVIDPNIVIAVSAVDVQAGDRVRWASGAAGTVVDRSFILETPRVVVSLDDPLPVAPGERGQLQSAEGQSILGHVTEGTSIEALIVRASPAAKPTVEEGRLLSATIRLQATLFQVTRAKLVERSDGMIRRQQLEIQARKLGVWNANIMGFDQIPWVADAGTPVVLIEPESGPETIVGVGRVPGTSYEIGIRVPDLVTHNTAILGILGVGKTSLAWELVQRMIVDRVRVVVLDITGEYGDRFGTFFPDDQSAWMYDQIEARIGPTRNNTAAPKESAGNHLELKDAFAFVLERFTSSPGSVLVINPAALEITQEDGFPSGGVVPLRRLSTPEVTRLLLEAILEHAKERWPTDPSEPARARLCVVLEEAHSLVPEGGSSDRAEAAAAAKAARAILQGRKYGVGCLLITQRTANVTKTILNQCHTVFAMRSFDATSEQFLANYLGSDYASLLPSLREKQSVLFGRGSTSRAPILIELNDREDFASQWRPKLAGADVTRLDATTDGSPAAPEGSDAEPGEATFGSTPGSPADVDDLDDLPF